MTVLMFLSISASSIADSESHRSTTTASQPADRLSRRHVLADGGVLELRGWEAANLRPDHDAVP